MQWLEPGSLMPPAPAEFVGGVARLPADAMAYVTLDLEPGRYLFVSQYTSPQGVWEEVVVDP